MKVATLKKRLSQLNAKLRLFLRWNTDQGISNYGSRRVQNTIFQILKLEAKIDKLEPKEDYNKKVNSKIFKAFRDKFENATILIPEFDEEIEETPKLSIKFASGEISIINYQVFPSNYYFQHWGKNKRKYQEMSSALHGLYAAIGVTLAKR